MTTRGKFTKIAVAAVATGAMILPATGAMAASKTDRAIIGALIGGVAGAALSNGDGGATAIGAGVGALVGASTKDSDRHRHYRSSRNYDRGYYRDARYRTYERPYYNDRYDSYGRYDTNYRYYGR